MLKQKKGIVVEVTQKHIVLLCSDGIFKNIKRSESEFPLVGEHYSYTEKETIPSWIKYAGVACLVCIFAWVFFTTNLFQMKPRQPAYILVLDVNPSLEIQLDDSLEVINIAALNKDGENIVAAIDYKEKPIFEMMDEIIQQCVQQDYINKKETGLITVSIIPMMKDYNTEEPQIKPIVNQSLNVHAVEAEVEIFSDNKEIYEQARNLGTSVNKYRIYQELKEKGIDLSMEELVERSVGELMKLNPDHNRNKGKSPVQSPGSSKKNPNEHPAGNTSNLNPNSSPNKNKPSAPEKTDMVSVPGQSKSKEENNHSDPQKENKPSANKKDTDASNAPQPTKIDKNKNNFSNQSDKANPDIDRDNTSLTNGTKAKKDKTSGDNAQNSVDTKQNSKNTKKKQK